MKKHIKIYMKDMILERYSHTEDVLFADGFDAAIVGFDPNNWKVVYSRNKCVDILSQEMDEEEAIEYLEYNTFAAMVGEKTPIWIDDEEAY